MRRIPMMTANSIYFRAGSGGFADDSMGCPNADSAAEKRFRFTREIPKKLQKQVTRETFQRQIYMQFSNLTAFDFHRPSAMSVFSQLERDSFRKRHTLYNPNGPDNSTTNDRPRVDSDDDSTGNDVSDDTNNHKDSLSSSSVSSFYELRKNNTHPELSKQRDTLLNFDSLPKNFSFKNRGKFIASFIF